MNKKRKILVAVTGMSPQIVTETLYALVVQQQWLPDEVHVLTTGAGAEKIRTALLRTGISPVFVLIMRPMVLALRLSIFI